MNTELTNERQKAARNIATQMFNVVAYGFSVAPGIADILNDGNETDPESGSRITHLNLQITDGAGKTLYARHLVHDLDRGK